MPTPEFNTLEEARAEILRLNGELERAETERDNYSNIATETGKELEKVRELNQKYFLELSAKYDKDEPEKDDDDEPVNLEDFARTLTI